MITLSFLGSLSLIPILFINTLINIPTTLNIIYFSIVVICMILEHARRVRHLNLNVYLTLTWILYRIIWLPILI